jgi:hypothetical protein
MTAIELAKACEILASRDPDLARSLGRLGPPPLWNREPGFPTLAISRGTHPVEPLPQSPTVRPHSVTSPPSKPSVKIELGLSNR